MTLSRAPAVLLSTGLLLAGCAAWQTEQTVSPTSYQLSRSHIPRNVGKLRRLVILPVVQQPPRACGTKTDGEAEMSLSHDSVEEVANFLVKRRGYDVVTLTSDRHQSLLDIAANADFINEVTAWSGDTEKDTPVGPLLAAFVAQAGLVERVDGVLLLHVQDSCARANSLGRTLLGVASLGASEILVDPKLQELFPLYRVAIIETASKRPAWRNRLDMAWSGARTYFSFSGEKKPYYDYLFQDLEAAVPKLLTR